MNSIKNALTRKIGPLPAWAWLAIFAVAVIYYRNKFTTMSGTGTGSVTPGPGPEPGTGSQVLQPGESVYDPTAGTLVTAPGGGGTDTTGTNTSAADLGAAMDNLANAIATGMPPTQVNVVSTSTPGSAGTSGTKKGKSHKGGHNGRAGNHHGKAKSKGQHRTKISGKITGKGPWKNVGRSGASIKNHAGGRTGHGQASGHGASTHSTANAHGTANNGKGKGRAKTQAATPNRTQRQRPKTPAVQQVVRQRAVATHPTASTHRVEGGTPPRPSSPGPRTVRAPARAPARPAPRRRK